MAAALDELAKRIESLAAEYHEAKRDDLAGELYEVERALAGAVRRVQRVAGSQRA